MNFEEHAAQDARLIILKGLSREPGNRLNSTLLTRLIEDFGHHRSREWVHTQLFKLRELNAVRLTQAGSVYIAELTQAGLDHIERRSIIEGVAKPSLGD